MPKVLPARNDVAILKSVIAVFVSAPDQVMSALQASKNEGLIIMTLDGKTTKCLNIGQSQTIEFSW
jgi:hypothetical protein